MPTNLYLDNIFMNDSTLVFKDCFKTFTTDQDKALKPEETVATFYKKIEKTDTKILSEVKRIDNGRLNIPVYFSVCGDDATELTGTKKQMGKGASPIQAEASACMELAERFSFFAFKENPENFIVGDYKMMQSQGYPVIALRYLLDSVHDETSSEELLSKLLENIPMQWTWGSNITTGKRVLIPFSWFFAINEFNGPSAGNSIEEAALQGICEIVERHVCSLINRDKISTPKIDKSSITDPVALELIDKFDKQNIELYINDFTLNMGICSVGALAIDRSTFPEKSEIVYTAGTTTDPEKAIIRAVTEVAQLAGDFNSNANYVASGLPKPLSMEEVEYLTKSDIDISVKEIANISDNNMKVEIDSCIDCLQSQGQSIFMIDVTHQELEIPALYTIIPGAHFRERSDIRNVGLFSAKLLMELVGDIEEKNRKLSQMEQLIPGAYYLEFYRGKNLFEMGLYNQALEHFSESLTRSPEEEDLPYIYSYLGSCYKEMEQYNDAISVLKRGIQEDDERPDMHNSLGVCYFKKGEYKKAIPHFERAVQLNPASAIDYANLGVNYHKIGKNQQAVEFLTLSLTLDPGLSFAEDLLKKIQQYTARC